MDTYTGSDAAGVGDATRQRPRCRAVVIHVDRPVFVLLTSAALKLPKHRGKKKIIRVVLQGLTFCKKRLNYLEFACNYDSIYNIHPFAAAQAS